MIHNYISEIRHHLFQLRINLRFSELLGDFLFCLMMLPGLNLHVTLPYLVFMVANICWRLDGCHLRKYVVCGWLAACHQHVCCQVGKGKSHENNPCTDACTYINTHTQIQHNFKDFPNEWSSMTARTCMVTCILPSSPYLQYDHKWSLGLYIEDCKGWWLSGGHSVEHWQLRWNTLDSIPCSSILPHNIKHYFSIAVKTTVILGTCDSILGIQWQNPFLNWSFWVFWNSCLRLPVVVSADKCFCVIVTKFAWNHNFYFLKTAK